MADTLEEFRAAFRVDALAILTTAHWTWSLRPAQPTLGCGVLSLNRLCPTFGEMTDEEARDLAVAVREIERRLAATFAPDRINYLMFMLRDRHVHMHVVPRYADARDVDGQVWRDAYWPRPIDFAGTAADAPTAVLEALRQAFSSA